MVNEFKVFMAIIVSLSAVVILGYGIASYLKRKAMSDDLAAIELRHATQKAVDVLMSDKPCLVSFDNMEQKLSDMNQTMMESRLRHTILELAKLNIKGDIITPAEVQLLITLAADNIRKTDAIL